MLSFIYQFDVTIVQIPGKDNLAADILSNSMGNLNSLETNILKEETRKKQENRVEIKHILNS